MSPDDSDFERIYQSFQPGLLVVACGGGYFRPLQSFCFSLKAAAIRKGTNAMHFDWNYSRETWDSTGGVQHFKDFIELHRSRGVRLFFIDGSPQSGSGAQRTAELIRSPMALGWIDHDIAELIHQEVISNHVTVIVTALGEVVAAENVKQAVRDLDSAIQEKQRLVEEMRAGINELERQFGVPNAEAAIAALPNDVAEQMRQVREALPRLLLRMREGEDRIAELAEVRRSLKKKMSASKSLAFLRSSLYSGAWKGILLSQDRADDDWYSATTAIGDEVARFGPLYFIWECPESPKMLPPPESTANRAESVAEHSAKPGRSWLRRLFG